MAGDWSGTLESPDFPIKTIDARFFQEGDEIDGSWNTVSSEVRWVGAVSAYVAPGGKFDGDMTFEHALTGTRCYGVGALRGTATDTAATLTWTLSTYDLDACGGRAPGAMTMRLRR